MTVLNSSVADAASFLRNDELVAIPTETVYGLAGNALNAAVVLKIFEAKERPSFDPLIVHIPSKEAAFLYAEDVPPVALKLMEAFWPGPLTLVLKKKSIIPDVVTSGLDTVGLRMPNHSMTLELLNHLDFPLAAPSANPFGYISPTTAQHVMDQLDSKIAMVLDGSACKVGVESTIVGFEEGETVIYRLGGLTPEDIRKVAGEVAIRINSSSDPKAPGMLKIHYAPSKPLYISNDLDQLIEMNNGSRLAVICFGDVMIDEKHAIYNLSATGDFTEAASNLFAYLRAIDKRDDIDAIVAAYLPETSLGFAINDRLSRAAVK
jgi:L-threonylcarbamoyladenylate synthase